MTSSDESRQEAFRAKVVAAILDQNPERALEMLCEYYKVDRPTLSVGVVKGRSKGIQAVYTAARKEIRAANREYLYDPFTILHEFYHHLRYHGERHRGTEKYADRFAESFIVAYNTSAMKALAERQRISRGLNL